MDKSKFDALLPNPGQIIKFICRNFSHIDDQNDASLKKSLDRFASGNPKDSEEAFELLFRQMRATYGAIGRQNSIALNDSFSRAWQSYIVIVRDLKCGPLPKQEVVRILDEQLFKFLFQDLLDLALKPIGISSGDILGKPRAVTKTVWKSYQKKMSNYKFSRELASKVHAPESDGWISSSESWRKRLGRITSGGNLSVRDILRLSEINQDVKFALLVANAYRCYCDLPYIKDCISGHSAVDRDPVRDETWFSELQEYLIRGNLDFMDSLNFPHGFQQVFASAKLFTSAKRLKEDGDLVQAERALDDLKNMTEALSPEFSDMPLRGHFYMQSRELKKASRAFEDFCEHAKFRDGPMLKAGLTWLLPLAVFLGDKRLVRKWEKWGSFFGLVVNLQRDRARVLLRKMFPNRFVEVNENLNVELSDFGFYDRDAWMVRNPDLKYPDRRMKGYANVAWPQISIFAHSGQSMKVAELVSEGAEVNLVDVEGFTPLMRAVEGKCELCVDLILSQTSGEYLNKVVFKTPYHALSAAIDSCDVETVKKLLDAGGEVDLRNGMDRTSLFSIMCELKPLHSGLISLSAEDLEGYDRVRHPGYIHTVSPFRQDQVEGDLNALVENESLVKTIREFQRAQLSEIAHEIVLLLLEFGADIHAVHRGGFTPLLAAREHGLDQIYETMLSHSN